MDLKFNIKDETKKRIKIVSIVTASVLIALYAAFLFILPNVINLNNFTPMISNEIEKMTGFKFEAQNLKLKTTFKLGIKVDAESISLKYKDNTTFLNFKSPQIEINLPTILIGHINLDTIKSENIEGYLTFTKDKKYTINEYINNILKNSAPETNAQTQENTFNFPIELRNININVDKISLYLNDENVNKTYITELNNSIVSMKSLNGPLKFQTEGFVGIKNSDTKFINLDVKLKTKLPKTEESSTKTSENAILELPDFNINPVRVLEDFNFRTDIKANLDIKDIEDFKAKGSVDIENFSLKLGGTKLPESNLNLIFKDRNIDLNSNLYISENEFMTAKSNIKTGKNSKLDLNIKTEKITLASLKNILSAIFDICLIENDLNNIALTGYITSDFNLNTNFKNIKSNGFLRLIDGDLSYNKANLRVNKITSFLDFSDNSLNIKDTNAYINGSKFEIEGQIAQNSDININIKSDPVKIKDLISIMSEFKLISPKDIADFQFNDGLLSILINVLGDFNNIHPKADIDLSNFQMLVKSANMPIGIENVKITARPKGKDDIEGTINVKNVTASIKEPVLRFNAPDIKLAFDMQNIELKPLNAVLEGTKINVSGDILNYMKNPELNIKVNGNIHPNTIFAFIPREFRKDISYKGAMPYNAIISGTLDNIKITGDIKSNPSNYIGMIDIPSQKGLENILTFDMALKNDILDLNDISIKSQTGKLANAKGQIKNLYEQEPSLSNLNVNLPNKTYIIMPFIENTSLTGSGNITLQGKAFSPEITGNIDINGLNYPDFGLTLETLALNFNKSVMNAKAKNARVAKSDFSGDANISTNFANGITLNSLNYNSNYIDSDELIALADKIAKTMPAPNPSQASNADLGIILKTGHANINRLKSGTLNIENIAYDHTISNNVYNLNNLSALFAQGKAQGKCSYNILNGKISVDMQADNISMKDAAKAFIGKEIIRAGTLNGKAKLSLSGATYEEQMKSLKGTVSFEVKNGEYGDSISFTRFLNAVNVLNLSGFKTALTAANSKINTTDTQAFQSMTGILTFNNGIANISSFKSQGPNMSLYANGSFNMLNNYANLKITGLISSKVAGFLGTLGTDKIQTTVEKVSTAAQTAVDKMASNLTEKYSDNKGVQAGLKILGAIKNAQTNQITDNGATQEKQTAGQVISTIIKEKANPLFGTISESDIANVPSLSTNETQNTKNFQVTLNGLITSPKAVKSFKFYGNK